MLNFESMLSQSKNETLLCKKGFCSFVSTLIWLFSFLFIFNFDFVISHSDEALTTLDAEWNKSRNRLFDYTNGERVEFRLKSISLNLPVKVFILAVICSPPVRDRKSKDHAHSDAKLLELINEEKIFRLSALSNSGMKRSSTWI